MKNYLLSHNLGFETQCESKELCYFEESLKDKLGDSTTNTIWYSFEQFKSEFWSLKPLCYNFETNSLKEYTELFYKLWTFNLPCDEKLIVQRSKPLDSLKLYILNKEKSIYLPEVGFVISAVLFYNQSIYVFGKCSQWCKIIKNSGKFKKRIKWKKMPKLWVSIKSCLSCIGYFNKMLITANDWNSLYLYDKTINSLSELPLILRTGHKILAAHDLKIYIISFPGSIYVNYSGNLEKWNILLTNTFDSDLDYEITYTFFNNSFYIAYNGKFYKFNFDKDIRKLEKLHE